MANNEGESAAVEDHALFVSDFLQLTTPIHRHLGLLRQPGLAELRELCERIAASTPIAPGARAPMWTARVDLGRIHLGHNAATVHLGWLADSTESPTSGIEALLHLEAAGLDHTRIGIEGGVAVRDTQGDSEARWLAEGLCRAMLTGYVATSRAHAVA
jgi:hypothetical protein